MTVSAPPEASSPETSPIRASALPEAAVLSSPEYLLHVPLLILE